MQRIGITRKLDDVGRVTVPKQIRRSLKLGKGDEVEWFLEGNEVILRKSPLYEEE